MKCWPFGDPWACTTATWAVTCWLFWLSPLDSATRICESLESDDSKGTTSMTLTLPDGAVWRIIFFYRKENFNGKLLGKSLETLTWLRLTWCSDTGVSCVVRWTSEMVFVVVDDEIDELISESSPLATDVTVMKFLAVANLVAISSTFQIPLFNSEIWKAFSISQHFKMLVFRSKFQRDFFFTNFFHSNCVYRRKKVYRSNKWKSKR